MTVVVLLQWGLYCRDESWCPMGETRRGSVHDAEFIYNAREASAMRLCKVTPLNEYHFLVELGYETSDLLVMPTTVRLWEYSWAKEDGQFRWLSLYKTKVKRQGRS